MRIPALIGALLFSSSLMAQSESEQGLLFNGGAKAMLAYKRDFSVTVVDNVTGGCLSNPQSLQALMTEKLTAAGYPLSPQSPKPLGDKIVINVQGHLVSGNACVIHVEAWLNHWLVANVPYAKRVPSGNQTYLSTRHSLGQQLYYVKKHQSLERTQQAVASLTEQLLSDLKSSQTFAEQFFPEMGQEYRRLTRTN